MSEPFKTTKKCKAINHPNLAPGWGCCNCQTYNGDQHTECKNCNHTRCDKDIEELVN